MEPRSKNADAAATESKMEVSGKRSDKLAAAANRGAVHPCALPRITCSCANEIQLDGQLEEAGHCLPYSRVSHTVRRT